MGGLKIKNKFTIISITTLILFGIALIALNNSKPKSVNNKTNAQIFLPKLADRYNSIYDHLDELKLDTINLMDKPLLDSNDFEYRDDKTIKLKKNIIIVSGSGLENSLIFNDKTGGILKFQYGGRTYNIDSKSPALFYNYAVYDICVVKDVDNIFLVKQKDFKKDKDRQNTYPTIKYKESIIGIPYVLVVDGKRVELGGLKVSDAQFEIPGSSASWPYAGVFDNMIKRVPHGNTLNIQ